MSNFKDSIFSEIDFNKFTVPIEETVKNAVENYWELDNVKIKVNAVNNFRDFREEKAISKINFFSSQIKIQNHRPAVFRLSEEFTGSILTKVLSDNSRNFNLQVLTDLEVKILNGFCEFLYKKIDSILFPVNEVKISEQSDKSINIIMLVSVFDNECSKIMLSIPKDRFKLEQLQKSVSFKDENFLASTLTVKIKAGSSKITLDELKNLGIGDIILLENSDSSKLTLISGEITKKFSVKADPSLILNIDTETEENTADKSMKRIPINDEVTMEKNLWDDIQIEINAEFEKVRMTIGELKQITQGQIVDLGSVFDNEISLSVEDKVVAKGDLIIINDRYAVKLNKVYSPQQQAAKPIQQAKQEQQQPQAKIPPKTQAKPAPKTNQQQAQHTISKTAPAKQQVKTTPRPAPAKTNAEIQKENFDYSDFEK